MSFNNQSQNRNIVSAFLFFATVLALSSCQDKKYTTVHIDLNETHSLPSIEIEQMICLESNDDILIGDIHKVRYHMGKYYVMDRLVSKNLFLFDSLGSFVSSLQRGRGPGEIEHFNEFFIDELNDLVYVYDYPEKIHVYDLYLNFLYSEIHEDLRIRSAELLNGDTLIINWPTGNRDSLELYSLYVLSEKRYLTSFMHIKDNLALMTNIFPISIYNDRILLSKTFDNFLYTINLKGPTESIAPREEYYFDFGRLAITEQDLIAGFTPTFEKSHMGERIVAFYSIAENSDFISFSFTLFGEINFMIYSKETGNYYYSADLFDAGLLPVCRLNNALSPNRFLAFAQPEDIAQFENANSSYTVPEEVSVFDNPCLIVFSLEEN